MKTLIYVPVFNRRHVTKLALDNLMQHKSNSSKLIVYNDWSTSFGDSYLRNLCDELVRLPAVGTMQVRKSESNKLGRGVALLRWHQFRSFLNQTEYDYLYMTDSDVLHDPLFEERLYYLHEKYDYQGQMLPVCLYNSKYHSDDARVVFKDDQVVIRKTIPGVSQFFSRSMCEKIVSALDRLGDDPDYGWDYRSVNYIDGFGLMSLVSYVEHFGASEDSMHSKKGDWNRDRALNPTRYLRDLWVPTIAEIERLSVLDEVASNRRVIDVMLKGAGSSQDLVGFMNFYEPQFKGLHRLFLEFQSLIARKLEAVARDVGAFNSEVKTRLYQPKQNPFNKILVFDIYSDRRPTIAVDLTVMSDGYKIEVFFRDSDDVQMLGSLMQLLGFDGGFIGKKFLVERRFLFDDDALVGRYLRSLVEGILEH